MSMLNAKHLTPEKIEKILAFSPYLSDERKRILRQLLFGNINIRQASEQMGVGNEHSSNIIRKALIQGLLEISDLSVSTLLEKAGANFQKTTWRKKQEEENEIYKYWKAQGIDFPYPIAAWRILKQSSFNTLEKLKEVCLEEPGDLLALRGIGEKKAEEIIKCLAGVFTKNACERY